MIETPKTVLVVDDDENVRETLRDVLEDEGYTVVEANHGREALELLRQGPPPSVILLDLMMPVMSGLEFLAALGAAGGSAPPVLVVSAAAREKIAAAARFAATTAVLEKPLRLEDLLAAVKKCC